MIEGFYGVPWTFSERADIVRFLAREHLDTYAFAPKNDPRHRRGWSRPFARSEREEWSRLFQLGDELGVRVVFGIAPEPPWGRALLSRRDIGTARELLRERVRDLVAFGCRSFLVAFDDTWPTLTPSLSGRAVGVRHGEVAADVRDAAASVGLGVDVFVVPAIYHRTVANLPDKGVAYLRAVVEASGAPVAWSGPDIFSRFIDRGDVVRLEQAIEGRVWIWNNVITNDHLPLASGETLGRRPVEKLSFGPPHNMSLDLVGASLGVLLNGAREASLTKISLACLALLRDAEGPQDLRALHARAIVESFPGEAAEILSLVYAHTCKHTFSSPAFHEGAALEGDEESAVKHLDALEQLPERLIGVSPDLERALAPTVAKLALFARASRVNRQGRLEEAASLFREAQTIRFQTAALETWTRDRLGRSKS